VYLPRDSVASKKLSTMAAADVQAPPTEAPGLPDYLLNPNAVLGDESAKWRYGKAPDYSNTRKVYEESMSSLVKSWIKEWTIWSELTWPVHQNTC